MLLPLCFAGDDVLALNVHGDVAVFACANVLVRVQSKKIAVAVVAKEFMVFTVFRFYVMFSFLSSLCD